jgi:urea transport system substrate-binding protein
VYLFKQAVEKIGSGPITPATIREALKGQEMVAPQGQIKIEPENLHTWLWPKIGQCQSDGQFNIIQQSNEWIKPIPYAAYEDQVCTASGLKKV